MTRDLELERIEQAMNAAIEQDLKVGSDVDVKVLSYLVVAEVMDSEGEVGTAWSYTAGIPDYRRRGMLDWLRWKFETTR
jgi:hypothetical protein